MSLLGGIAGIGRAAATIFGSKALRRVASLALPYAIKGVNMFKKHPGLVGEVADYGMNALKGVYNRHFQSQGHVQDGKQPRNTGNLLYDLGVSMFDVYKHGQKRWNQYERSAQIMQAEGFGSGGGDTQMSGAYNQ